VILADRTSVNHCWRSVLSGKRSSVSQKSSWRLPQRDFCQSQILIRPESRHFTREVRILTEAFPLTTPHTRVSCPGPKITNQRPSLVDPRTPRIVAARSTELRKSCVERRRKIDLLWREIDRNHESRRMDCVDPEQKWNLRD
jgi:hypothetical protein